MEQGVHLRVPDPRNSRDAICRAEGLRYVCGLIDRRRWLTQDRPGFGSNGNCGKAGEAA
jgi:hypothetical protein